MGVLSGKEIVLGVTGGIAAYKACEIIRELRGEGANVHVILTASGSQFITPLTLQTLSKNPVFADLFNLISESEIGHISLAQRAHLLLIAPATANILGKIRAGIADDLLSTVVMATAAPVVLAPAMNSQMYASAAVRENVEVLRSRGFLFVEPDEGELACGTVGPGRLTEVGKIVEMARIVLAEKILGGKKVVVSAGPTAENIDPVRFLSNRASGKMGFALARVARRFGAEVTLVTGPSALADPYFMKTVRVRSTEEMQKAVERESSDADAVLMCAAVADFRAAAVAPSKIKKDGGGWKLELTPTVDILDGLGRNKGQRILVGFAAETGDIEQNAIAKMRTKNLDAIVANDVSRTDIGFESDDNEVRIFFADGEVRELPLTTKEGIAVGVWLALSRKLFAR
ncbi:MAG TPA: bifunctional phosphopantothenoylcysteine decarboxylase/phosphopantothenate--cysteine ligase CoaBC [Candidatus Deferrimicrobiaceae bacterium]|nr:bifunctional phosphopantothenoylcysteine decarboxylase/phosphopantothenate--cysteine ligase CoaBC [Candidatus Deferrimicrobiaceae bacterium]